MRYIKSRIFTVTNIHSGHVTMASIETNLQPKKKKKKKKKHASI